MSSRHLSSTLRQSVRKPTPSAVLEIRHQSDFARCYRSCPSAPPSKHCGYTRNAGHVACGIRTSRTKCDRGLTTLASSVGSEHQSQRVGISGLDADGQATIASPTTFTADPVHAFLHHAEHDPAALAGYGESQIAELFRAAVRQRLASVVAALVDAMQLSASASPLFHAKASSARRTAGLRGLQQGLQELRDDSVPLTGSAKATRLREGHLLSSFLQPSLIARTFETLLVKRADGGFTHALPDVYSREIALHLATGLAETRAAELAEVIALLVHRACDPERGSDPKGVSSAPWKLESRLPPHAVGTLVSYFSALDPATPLTPALQAGQLVYSSRRDACIAIIKAVAEGSVDLNRPLRLASADSSRFGSQPSGPAVADRNNGQAVDEKAETVRLRKGGGELDPSDDQAGLLDAEQPASLASEARFQAMMHSFIVRLYILMGRADEAAEQLSAFSRWCGEAEQLDQLVVLKYLADEIARLRLTQSGPEAVCGTIQKFADHPFARLSPTTWTTPTCRDYAASQGVQQEWVPRVLEEASKLDDPSFDRFVRMLESLHGSPFAPPRVPVRTVIEFLSVINARLLGRSSVIQRLGHKMGLWQALKDDQHLSSLSELEQIAVLRVVSAAKELGLLKSLWYRWAGNGPVLEEYTQGRKHEAPMQEPSIVTRSSICMSAMVKALTNAATYDSNMDDNTKEELLALASEIIGRFRGANPRQSLGHRDLTLLGDASFRVGDRKNALAAFRSILHRDHPPSSYDVSAIIGNLAALDLDYACALLQKTVAMPDVQQLTPAERRTLVGDQMVLSGAPALHAYEVVFTHIVRQQRPDLAIDLLQRGQVHNLDQQLPVQVACEVRLLLASTEHERTGDRASLKDLPRAVQHAIKVGWRINRRTMAALLHRVATVPAGGLHRSKAPLVQPPRERQREPAGGNWYTAEQLLGVAAENRLMGVDMATLVIKSIGSAANHQLHKSAETSLETVYKHRRRTLGAALDRVVAFLRWAPMPPNHNLLRNPQDAKDSRLWNSPNLLGDFKAYRNILNVYMMIDDPHGVVELMSWVRDENGLSIDVERNSRFIEQLIQHIKTSKNLKGDEAEEVIRARLLAELAGDVPTRRTKSWWDKSRTLARFQAVDRRREALDENRAYVLYPPSNRPVRTMPGSTPPAF